MFKKTFPIIILATTLVFLIPIKLSLSAQTPTPGVAGEKIDEIRKQLEESVKDTLGEITNNQEKRGWIGTITEISPTGVEIQVNNQSRSISLNDKAEIIDENRQSITFDSLEVDNRIIALGYTQIDGSLDGRRIIITAEREPLKRRAVFGTIIEKAAQDEIMLIRNKDESIELIFGENSLLKVRKNGQLETIDYEDISIDQKIVAVISPTDGNTDTYQVENMVVISSSQDESINASSQSEEE